MSAAKPGVEHLHAAARELVELAKEVGWTLGKAKDGVLLVSPDSSDHGPIKVGSHSQWNDGVIRSLRNKVMTHGDKELVEAFFARETARVTAPYPMPAAGHTLRAFNPELAPLPAKPPVLVVEPEPEVVTLEPGQMIRAGDDWEAALLDAAEPERVVAWVRPAVSHEAKGTPHERPYKSPVAVERGYNKGLNDWKCAVKDCDWHVVMGPQRRTNRGKLVSPDGTGDNAENPVSSVASHFNRMADGRHDRETADRHFPEVPFGELKEKGPRIKPEPEVTELQFEPDLLRLLVEEPLQTMPDFVLQFADLLHPYAACQQRKLEEALAKVAADRDEWKALAEATEEEKLELIAERDGLKTRVGVLEAAIAPIRQLEAAS